MRTTITLDDDVFEAAQSLAKASNRRLGEVLSVLVRRGLRAPAAATRKNGLPVFEVAADAGVIPSDRAGDMLSEER